MILTTCLQKWLQSNNGNSNSNRNSNIFCTKSIERFSGIKLDFSVIIRKSLDCSGNPELFVTNICRTLLNFSYETLLQVRYNSSLSKNWFSFNCFKLRCDERFTHAFTTHVVSFSKKLRWLADTKVITLKTQLLQ